MLSDKDNELSLYRGRDIEIVKGLVVMQNSLGQIEEFGEQRYFNAVYTLTSVGADLKWQLDDLGLDYTQVKDYDLFIRVLSTVLESSKKQISSNENLTQTIIDESIYNPMALIIKDFDFADYELCENENKREVLYNKEKDIVIDEDVYSELVRVVRIIHGLKRNNELPANETTKRDMIEDARDEYLASQGQPYTSILKPLISTMINTEGYNYNHNTIWDVKLYAFLDDIKRQGKIQDAKLLLQGAIGGTVNLKHISKERLNRFAKII